MNLSPLSDIFEVVYGHQLDLNKMKRTSALDGIAFVNRTARQNGVVAIVERVRGLKPAPAGVLTIALGGSILSTFLQVKPFYTGQNVAVATPRQPMSNAELLYYAAAIKANAFRYSTCGREANRTFRSIMVPAFDNLPDWVRQVKPDMFDNKDAPAVSGGAPALQPADWKLFRLGDIFDIRKGRRLTKANIKPGDVPFIGAVDKNNGFRQWTDRAIHDAGTITVPYNGNGVGEAFYQPTPFWATDDVNVLYPRFSMTSAVALFICAVIRRDKYRYNYGRKWHLERMNDSTLKLPTTPDGRPDIEYMEGFIERLPFSGYIKKDAPPPASVASMLQPTQGGESGGNVPTK